MAKFIVVIALSGLAAVLVSGAGDKKGATLKINSITVKCQPTVSLIVSASKSESDCSGKCKKDSNCRFAVYQGKDKKCGLVPTTSDCIFGGSVFEDVLLGFSYKKFTTQDNSQPSEFGMHPLKSKLGNVLSSANGVSTDQCRDLCDIHPKCQMAFYTAGMGQMGCSLVEKSGVNKVPDPRGTYTVYAAA